MKFTVEHLSKFAAAMDAELPRATELMLMDLPYFQLLHYPSSKMTEVPTDLTDSLRRAHDAAVARTGIHLPYTTAQISDFPFLFESRLTPYPYVQGLKKLQLLLADRHDVVVWMLLKGNRKGIAEVETLGHQAHISFEPLLDAFCAIDSSHPSFRTARAAFLSLVENLFGKTCEAQAEATIGERLG